MKRKLLLVSLALLLAISALATTLVVADPDEGELLTGSFYHGPYLRTYEYYVPASYDGSEPVPMMLSFHGMAGNGPAQRMMTGLTDIADEEGFIAVFPDSTRFLNPADLIDPGDGTDHRPDLPQILPPPFPPLMFIIGVQWDPGIGIALQYYPSYQVDDVGFVSELIDTLSGELNIDQTRVYATGFSSGSMFCYHLAMELSNKIAAVAGVASPMTLLFLEQEPVRPIPVIAVQGDADTVVPFEGGKCYFNALRGEPVFVSFYGTGAYWAEKDGIDTEPTVTQVADNIVCTTYSGGHYGTEVILYQVEGGGHAWVYYPELNSMVLWDLLKEYTLPEFEMEWLPPLTVGTDFLVKDGTVLPLKFQLLGYEDGNVVEDMQDVSVTIEGEGVNETWELNGGREGLRFDEKEFCYILNLHTKDFELLTGSVYKTTVYDSDGHNMRSISFEVISSE